MSFNSIEFFVFFALVVVGNYVLPQKYRWMLLLSASYYFYMCWKAEYILLIVFSTLIDYFCGLRMANIKAKAKRKKYLILSLCVNLGVLFAFKYFNLFNDSLRSASNHFNIFYNVPSFNMLLPVGISFYTFQTLSYSIEVYRGNQKAEKHLGIFALYVSFFPQLVAGPIERAGNLIKQFYRDNTFQYERVKSGILLMAWGIFKKIVIADRLAAFVNQVYNNPTDYVGVPLIVATYFFAFQIYCDFSGYSDIAIGTARILGIDLMRNFNQPYLSRSIPEFWKRWHISLSTWFRDYLYIPLGGNRVVFGRLLLNLILVFSISGLWHGANWTFVLWGLYHGALMVIAVLVKKGGIKVFSFLKNNRLMDLINMILTFNLVCVGWVLFRANSISDAGYIYMHSLNFSGSKAFLSELMLPGRCEILLGLTKIEIIVAVLVLFVLQAVEMMNKKYSLVKIYYRNPMVCRWLGYGVISLSILFLGYFSSNLDFIYFKF
ncbi:MAG: MBOAT family protein [Candidatus Omnitrophica bacterium]|nr:MBOAT family protein [Candidatus Omnitrophota bacterium]